MAHGTSRIPAALYGTDAPTWLIVGASRGIGLEFVRQLLGRDTSSVRIFATVRERNTDLNASALWRQAGGDHGRCQLLVCDVLSEESIAVRIPISSSSTPYIIRRQRTNNNDR